MNLYFIGIGGIGMSNLARYFLSKGDAIAGYDLTSPLTSSSPRAGGRGHTTTRTAWS